MYLQLAENGNGYIPPSAYMADPGQLIRIKGYRRRGSRVPSHLRRLSEDAAANDNPYVYLPAHVVGMDKGLMVREDYFDDFNNEEWKALMWQLAPFQPQVQQGMSENYFLASRADRKAKRATKQTAKVDKKNAKTEIKNARAEAIRTGKGGNVLGTVTDTLKNIAGSIFGGGAPAPQEAGAGSVEMPGTSFWSNTTFGIDNKIFYPGTAVVVGGLIYAASRRKRKRSRR